MLGLNTKPKTLPILSSYEHITIAGRGVEKRMALHPVVTRGTYQTTLVLVQYGEPVDLAPSLRWHGEHDQIVATAAALDALLQDRDTQENSRQIHLNYRHFEPCDVRFFVFRPMHYNDTAQLTVYFHGHQITPDHLHLHLRIEGEINHMVGVYADFLEQIHLCDRKTALNCANSAKEQD